jgi:hypothetical protein
MKQPRPPQLIVGLGILTALSTATILRLQSHAMRHGSVKSVVVSSSGQILTTLFEGSRTDPKFSVRNILAKNSALPRCGQKTETPLLQSIFGPSVVYAICLLCECGGQGWMNFTDNCDTGGGCSGSYNNIRFVPDSPLGYMCLRSYCGSIPECGCEYTTC